MACPTVSSPDCRHLTDLTTHGMAWDNMYLSDNSHIASLTDGGVQHQKGARKTTMTKWRRHLQQTPSKQRHTIQRANACPHERSSQSVIRHRTGKIQEQRKILFRWASHEPFTIEISNRNKTTHTYLKTARSRNIRHATLFATHSRHTTQHQTQQPKHNKLELYLTTLCHTHTKLRLKTNNWKSPRMNTLTCARNPSSTTSHSSGTCERL